MRSDERVARQVGAALRRIRKERGVNQGEAAARCGIRRAMLSRYEKGRACPVLPNLVLVLQALDCTVEEFGRHLGPWGCLDN